MTDKPKIHIKPIVAVPSEHVARVLQSRRESEREHRYEPELDAIAGTRRAEGDATEHSADEGEPEHEEEVSRRDRTRTTPRSDRQRDQRDRDADR